jgi:hypothetical protein
MEKFSFLTTGAQLKKKLAQVLKQTELFKKIQKELAIIKREAKIKRFKDNWYEK